jgi:chemotaxis protein MotB
MMLALAALATAAGCVKQTDYDAKVAELSGCSQQTARGRDDLQQAIKYTGLMAQQLIALRTEIDSKTLRANNDLAETQKQLDDATALSAGLRTELQRTGADVDKLVAERGALSASLEQARKRLEQLRTPQVAAELRAERFKHVVERFQKLSDSGRLRVLMRADRVVLVVAGDALFDPGKADIKPAGQATIAEVARVLAAMPDQQLQVAGHTDTEPIHTASFPDNWHLSAARAIQVVELLIHDGIGSSAAYGSARGEFDPIAPNDTEENRARNRRIEITLEPNAVGPAAAAASRSAYF